MTTQAQPETPLHGLLTCGVCAEELVPTDSGRGRNSQYRCLSGPANGWQPCNTPRLDVALTDDLLLRRILHKLMTNEFIATALEEATGSPQGDPTGEHGLTKREVKSLKEDPEGFVASIGGTLAARKFLGGFIAEIQIQTDRAVVCYSIPLPDTNPLAGRYQQHIWLSEISLD